VYARAPATAVYALPALNAALADAAATAFSALVALALVWVDTAANAVHILVALVLVWADAAATAVDALAASTAVLAFPLRSRQQTDVVVDEVRESRHVLIFAAKFCFFHHSFYTAVNAHLTAKKRDLG
jgi:hypothetical protein